MRPPHLKFCTDRNHFSSQASVAGTIFPSVFPPLVDAGAVELGLSQPDVDAVVDVTEPLRERVATPGVRLVGFQPAEGKRCIMPVYGNTQKWDRFD